MTKRLTAVRDDLFDVARRVESIDGDYRIYFNGEALRYELHHARCRPTFQLNLGDRLDARAIEKIYRTRVSQIERLTREIETHNARVDAEKQRKIARRAMESAEKTLCAARNAAR